MQIPTPALARAADSQLLITDMQVRLAGAMQAAVRASVLHQCGIVLRAANLLQVPVLVTEQYPKGLGPTEPQLAELLPPSARRYTKTGFSCCSAEGFPAPVTAGGRGQVVIVGMEAHVCVLQTAFDLQLQGAQVFVVEDAVCSRRESNWRNAMERLRQAGVVVTNSESVLFEWMGDAGHEHFKAISALLR